MSDSVQETCAAIQQARFPIDVTPPTEADHPTRIQPGSERFDVICQSTFQGSLREQKRGDPTRQPSIWSPEQIQLIADFSRRRRLQPIFYAPPSMMARRPVAVRIRGELALGMVVWISSDLKDIEYSLHHEEGHLHDNEAVEKLSPQQKALHQQGRGTREDFVRELQTILKLLRKNVLSPHKNGFDPIVAELFGDFSQFDAQDLNSINLVLAEVFRFGEEIGSSAMRRTLLSPNYRHFKRGGLQDRAYFATTIQDTRGRVVDLQRLLLKVQLEEAGVWEEFSRRPDYDPGTIAHLQAPYLEFFRTCLRAAKRYFPNPQPYFVK